VRTAEQQRFTKIPNEVDAVFTSQFFKVFSQAQTTFYKQDHRHTRKLFPRRAVTRLNQMSVTPLALSYCESEDKVKR